MLYAIIPYIKYVLFSVINKYEFLKSIDKPQGMILVTGEKLNSRE